MGFDVCGSFFFGGAADLADHNDAARFRIFIEKLDGVDEVRADDRISSDSNAGGLADLSLRELAHGFVRQGSAARDDPHVAFQMNICGHDPDFAFARGNDSRTVRPDQPRLFAFQEGARTNHVEGWDAFGDANDQFDSRRRRFHYRVCGEWRRNENDRGIRASLAPGFLDSVEHVHSFVFGAALARRHPADNVSPIFHGLKRMKTAFTARDALNNQPCVLIRQYAHNLHISPC